MRVCVCVGGARQKSGKIVDVREEGRNKCSSVEKGKCCEMTLVLEVAPLRGGWIQHRSNESLSLLVSFALRLEPCLLLLVLALRTLSGRRMRRAYWSL